jgi:hypothetical protein
LGSCPCFARLRGLASLQQPLPSIVINVLSLLARLTAHSLSSGRNPPTFSSFRPWPHCTPVENGEIISGVVEKKTVGALQGGLTHVVFREKGPEATRTLFAGLQCIVNYWLSTMASASASGI